MQPTDIADPTYFHKVVDCQWACPAHTPVPEYIRLIAQGRYSDAYMVNWVSNVFPGILGRTCDRPCEPACRRGRVEEENIDKPEPVAICRLKRVAADHKDDIRDRLPKAQPRNGKRVACVGAGPASLTVARDLAPLGYHVTVFDSEAKAGGFMWTQIPRFRLPESVIDEETGYITGMPHVDFVAGKRIDSMKALLRQDFDAVFVGCGAPRGRDLVIPGRKEAADDIHIGIDWLASVSFEHVKSVKPRVIVLGGGNTAMDCCRSARRLGSSDVKVIVRSGFEEMKASPWEKEDAMHEGIPIINCHVPKAFVHEAGKLVGMNFEIVEPVFDAKGRRTLKPTGAPEVFFACDEVLIAVGQENAFPWIERDAGIDFDEWGLPRLNAVTLQSSRADVFFGGDAAFGPKNIITAVAHGHEAAVSIDLFLQGEDVAKRPPPMTQPDVAEDGHPRMELRQRGVQRPALQGALGQGRDRAGQHPHRGGTGLRRRHGLQGNAALPELRRADQVHAEPVHRMRCLRRHLPDRLHQLHRQRRRSRSAHAAVRRRRTTWRRRCMSAATLKTGRVMVKDEDVCLHCGLCAERCPTGAWDMQKFLIEMTHAGPACRDAHGSARLEPAL